MNEPGDVRVEHDEDSPEAERLQIAMGMRDFGIEVYRRRMRRANPQATRAEVDAMVWEWLQDPGPIPAGFRLRQIETTTGESENGKANIMAAREPTSDEWRLAFEALAGIVQDEYPGTLVHIVETWGSTGADGIEAVRVAAEFTGHTKG